MLIGEISRQTGVSIQTLRFYERKRVLRSPARGDSGYRTYGAMDLQRLGFIKQSQELGFTLKEIRELLDIHEQFAPPQRARPARWNRAVRIARERLDLIDTKLRALQAMRAQLAGALGKAAEVPRESCPVVSRSRSAMAKRPSRGADLSAVPTSPVSRKSS